MFMKMPSALEFVRKMQQDFREAPFNDAEEAQAQNIISEVWCKQILEALEKQEAQKPKIYKSHPEDLYLCPSCGSTFIKRNGVNANYCSNCGQAIDWGGVDE